MLQLLTLLRPPSAMAGDAGGEVKYPLGAESYRLLCKIGSGVSAVVYKAVCLPLGSSAVVAIKAIDLERSRANLEDVWREAKAMALLSHCNVLRAHCSFAVGSHLWVVMPFMAAGSLHSILSHGFPDGLPEPCVAVVLRDTLRALCYLHGQGRIHRDIKAGNILVDSDGSVKLADFGVSASIYETAPAAAASSGPAHAAPPAALGGSSSCFNDLAGTPYWMAPEVIHSHVGYGIKADIWSFGITALELAHGRPPLSHLPPSKSMLMRITSRVRLEDAEPAASGSAKRKKKFSKAFKDMVSSCLCQEPARRPSAEKLLRHPFFRGCRSRDYLVRNVLAAVPSIEERCKDAANLCGCAKGARCVSPCRHAAGSVDVVRNRRISGWNFNEENLEFDPAEAGAAEKRRGRLPFHEEEEEDDPAELESNSAGDGNEGTRTAAATRVSHDDEKAAAATGFKEVVVPQLMTILESLEVQRGMVMHVLESGGCHVADGGINGCGGMAAADPGEEMLLGYVRQLEHKVEELSTEVEEEMARNARLEKQVQERQVSAHRTDSSAQTSGSN
ncbi:serine/threonine-protein kinase BLUS1-like isoform X2 [Panicum virgatum]|uniref:serine/threonine-protein kinase BLUS1-like isoform X2 n=1 Tax=Panicum virgatum TaxID=38727 RepID=UPI0019D67AE9|nr:serine/threonine-protein kinase BLUS1-like isoform X2 [Panicum virgatum]